MRSWAVLRGLFARLAALITCPDFQVDELSLPVLRAGPLSAEPRGYSAQHATARDASDSDTMSESKEVSLSFRRLLLTAAILSKIKCALRSLLFLLLNHHLLAFAAHLLSR